MVKSEKLFSPQSYLDSVTGKCYVVDGDDDIEFINDALCANGYDSLWDYPLSEIDVIVESGFDVVLVDCMVYDEDAKEFKHELRWFEVPDGWGEDE